METQDRRHLEQMRMSLASDPASPAVLGRLVAELESLNALLVDFDDLWSRKFQASWGTLEEVLAVALDREMDTFDEESASLVATAISALRALVDEALTRIPTSSES